MCKAVDELVEKRRLDAMFDVVKNLMETMKLSEEYRAILLKGFKMLVLEMWRENYVPLKNSVKNKCIKKVFYDKILIS